MKELRPPSSGDTEIRILFLFHGGEIILLLAGGDKAGNWNRWYEENIDQAETRYSHWLARKEETK